ncbi:hypothetical protein BGX33_011181 [Mortierella sp. NVP41]|nr:hypothetical protein BGX33_011181 [Mortierella sp. NVP41]
MEMYRTEASGADPCRSRAAFSRFSRGQFIGQLGDFDDYASTIRTKLSQLEQLYQQIGKLTKLEYLDLQALTTADRFPWKPAYYGHNSSRHADH